MYAVPPAEAGLRIHGSASIQSVGQSVINAGNSTLMFLNYAKGMVQSSTQANYPATLTSDGFPTTASLVSQPWAMAPLLDPDYYGRYLIWWTGTGLFQFNPPAIVYNGGGSTNLAPANSGFIDFHLGIGFGTGATQPTQAAPVEFAFGTLVTGVTTSTSGDIGGAGLVKFTANSLCFSQTPTGSQFQFGNLTGLPGGPNLDGSWTINQIDNQTISLQGSSAYAGLVSINTSGTPGVNTEALLSVAQLAVNIFQGTTITSWSNIVFTKKAWQAAAIAAQLASPDYVSAMKALNPRFIRFMDIQGVQGDRTSAYAYRCQPSNFAWSYFHMDPALYAGTITKGAGDAYTAANNPSSSPAGGPYVDGETFFGQLSGANLTNNPTLALPGRTGSAPILSTNANATASQKNMFLTGTVPGSGKVQTFHFSGAGLSGTYSPTYTTGAGDTSLGALLNNIASQLRSDATLLAAGIVIPFNGEIFGTMGIQYNPNIGGLGASLLTVTASDAAGNTIYTFGTTSIGELIDDSYYYFTYSALIGAWFVAVGSTTTGGVTAGCPLELMVDLCNRVGCGLYMQIGQMWSADRIQKTAQFMAANLTGEFKPAFSNETWNSFENEWPCATTLGNCLGISNASNPNTAADSFSGLRMAQISQIVQAAWSAAGRSRSQLHVQLEYWNIDMVPSGIGFTSTVPNRFRGAQLNPASNTTLKNFGGLSATAITTNPSTGLPYDFSTFPNRPIDYSDECGGAPYYQGQQANYANPGQGFMTTDYNGTAITISAYNGLLLSAYNYVYGNSTQKAAALDFLYNENSGPAGDFYNGSLNGTQNNDGTMALWETTSGVGQAGIFGIGQQISSYDSARGGAGLGQLGYCCYEGDLGNGPIFAGDAQTISSLNALGYTNGYSAALPGAAAGPSGSGDTSTTVAANLVALFDAFKNDTRCQLLTTRYLNVCKNAGRWNGASSFINRISLGTRFGFDGQNGGGTTPGGSVWSMYPGAVTAPPFKSFNAYQAWNN